MVPGTGIVRTREYSDRYIPNRAAIDYDYALTMLTQKPNSSNPDLCSSSSSLYRKLLEETFKMDASRRILAFKNKPPTPTPQVSNDFLLATKYVKPPRRRHIPLTCVRKLDAPGLLDDYYLNLLDWGSTNVVCIALGHSVYLWDGSHRSVSELVTVDEESGPVTSVKWAPDGTQIAVGLNNSEVHLWDSSANTRLTTLEGLHTSRVGVMDWNNTNILTTGGLDGRIINNDLRLRDRPRVVVKYQGHRQEVCGLKWSPSGLHLASGGNDNLVRIWDTRRSTNASLHRLEEHTAAVKALSWSPFQANLLASGGGSADRCIKFWNTHTGACLNSVDTGSQVCALLWNRNERELLTSHGYTDNQLILWKYPSMVKIAELNGHTSRVLHLAESPDGCTVASAAAGEDESLRFWDVFGDPKVAASKTSSEPFANFNRIR